MPRGDGTGPTGQGPRTGRGQAGGRMGRQGGSQAAGPSGECVCPACGARVAHVRGKPCYEQICPECGAKMARV